MVLSPEERVALIKENLAEFIHTEFMEDIVHDGGAPKIYWGTACTGRPHTGYLVPAVKIVQFLAAGCDVTVLLADVHAMLDNLKSPVELVASRAKFYEFVISSLLKACGADLTKLRFVLGSSYQYSAAYVQDVYKLSTIVTQPQAKKAAAEIVKQTDTAPMGALIYPIMQVLDEEHLDCDVQFGGVDQRKLFTAANEWLPKIGYKKRAHLMNPMVAGLNGAKMSSSDENSKIDLLDPAATVAKKINKSECVPRAVVQNGLLDLVKYVFLPVSELKTGTREFRVERPDAEPLVYNDIKQVQKDYENDVLSPQLLKTAVTVALNAIISSIQADYQASEEWQAITLKAYPPPTKKEKKVKNLGTRFPGAKGGENAEAEVTKRAEDLTIADVQATEANPTS